MPTLNARLKRTVEVLDVSARVDTQSIAATATLALTYPMTQVDIDTTAGSVTLTLPPAASVPGFLVMAVKTVAANTATLDGDASETINGSATLAWTTQWQSYTIVSRGDTWRIV